MRAVDPGGAGVGDLGWRGWKRGDRCLLALVSRAPPPPP